MRTGKKYRGGLLGSEYGKHWDPSSWGELRNARTTCTNGSGVTCDQAFYTGKEGMIAG